jgi:signal peptidase I
VGVNFPLILVLTVAFTGAISLIDTLFLKARRMAIALADLPDAPGDIAEVVGPVAEPVLVEYSKSFFPVLLVVLVLRSFLVEPFQIPTGSMIPTLKVGDFIVVNKFAYGIRLPVINTKIFEVGEPTNGDVMVFIPPHENEYFIKRVIGTPGDRIRYEDKRLYINDVLWEQEFVAQLPPQNPRVLVYREQSGDIDHLIYRNPFGDSEVREWVVSDGHYFMMGDNRDNSHDSRAWGEVSEDMIVGKAFAVWLHKEPGWNLPSFDHNGWIE